VPLNKLFAVIALASVIALMSGCAYFGPGYPPGSIPVNTKLAVSADGNRVLVSWNEQSGKLKARLVELKGNTVASITPIELPQETYTTAFSRDGEKLLLTTTTNQLLKVHVRTGEVETLYKSPVRLRFPLEMNDSDYVFLEGQGGQGNFSYWQRLKNNEKTQLNDFGYGRSTELSQVRNALFLLEPWTPPRFRAIHGNLPAGLTALVESDTFLIRCADRLPLVCLHSRLWTEKPNRFYYAMEIINGKQVCKIPGEWIAPSSLMISRDGSTVVFHVPLERHDGPRAIYFVRNTQGGCTVNEIQISDK